MDKEDILNLEEGEGIDTLIAEKVMGWHKTADTFGCEYWADSNGRYQHGIGKDNEYDSEMLHLIDWHPSSSLLWAWEVVEKAQIGMLNNVHGRWEAYIVEGSRADAETAPLAICRAALLSVMENE